jgi:excisionase family DNA binding protein
MAEFQAPDWLSPSQAAHKLQVSPHRVRQLVAEGRLGAVMTPLGRLVKATDVAALAAERGQQASPPPMGVA